MPVNTLLFIYGVEWPERVWTYARLAWIASILGGITAYGIGSLLPYCGAEKLLCYLFSPESLASFGAQYCQKGAYIAFMYGLLPLPYKIITISAGFFHVPFIPFVLSIAAARAIRFFGIGLALSLWGKQLQQIIDRHFALCVFLVIVTIILMLKFSL